MEEGLVRAGEGEAGMGAGDDGVFVVCWRRRGWGGVSAGAGWLRACVCR